MANAPLEISLHGKQFTSIFRKWKQEGVFEELMYRQSENPIEKISESWYNRLGEAHEALTMYRQSKIDCELSTRKFRVKSDSRPIRCNVVKEFEHYVPKFMFCPIELRVDDLLSEELPQPLRSGLNSENRAVGRPA
jgi:hypothetical protein